MVLQCHGASLGGVILVEPQVFEDDRGFFLETYQQARYTEKGIVPAFVQDNHSHSRKGSVRGLHYQLKHPQGKLVYAVVGRIFDVVLDIRHGSPTFGNWCGAVLSDENKHQIYIPPGFAHGFSVLSERADVIYKCTDFYAPGDEYGIRWNDPELDIDWGVEHPILSPKDLAYPPLGKIPRELLPVFENTGSDT
ncbi:MAG: dTDP-4-dehydrorhamnose 3,5-epimerase [Deltaproteobacteria bacterium]|jgi:dTDP-4-dehydrorhamnose 3,5-epimerase|nr:dTDP-4-dehydrorhamnose 3,5-epimerase [Deltaproteobacteria bacterium]